MRLGWATNAVFLAHVELRMQQGLTQTHNLRTNLGQREIHVHFEVEWEASAAVLGGGQQRIVPPSIGAASPSDPATTSPAPARGFTKMAHTASNADSTLDQPRPLFPRPASAPVQFPRRPPPFEQMPAAATSAPPIPTRGP